MDISLLNSILPLLVVLILSFLMAGGIILLRKNILKETRKNKEEKSKKFYNNFSIGLVSAASFFIITRIFEIVSNQIPSFNFSSFQSILTSLLIYAIIISFGVLFLGVLVLFLIWIGIKSQL